MPFNDLSRYKSEMQLSVRPKENQRLGRKSDPSYFLWRRESQEFGAGAQVLLAFSLKGLLHQLNRLILAQLPSLGKGSYEVRFV